MVLSKYTAIVGTLAVVLLGQAFAHQSNDHDIEREPDVIEQPEPVIVETSSEINHDNSSITTNNTPTASSTNINTPVAASTAALVTGDTNVVALDYDSIDLANLPVGVCQGSSSTASGSGNDGLFGLSLGFGSSKIDKQCTLRRNIALTATLTNNQQLLASMVSQLEGTGAMWASQHPKCKKLLLKGSAKADKFGCYFPGTRPRCTNPKRQLCMRPVGE